jgi:hypothetical protein
MTQGPHYEPFGWHHWPERFFRSYQFRRALTVYEYAKSKGVKVTLRLTSAEHTGAEHCQHDNPTLGQELMVDWLADVFRIDQRKLLNSGSGS